MAPNGTTTAVNITELPGGIASESSFVVSGEGNVSFSVTLPNSLTLSNGSATMTVDNFQHDLGVTPSLGGNGSETLNVGARLNVGPSQAGGSYTGTFSVFVSYN